MCQLSFADDLIHLLPKSVLNACFILLTKKRPSLRFRFIKFVDVTYLSVEAFFKDYKEASNKDAYRWKMDKNIRKTHLAAQTAH